jgi:hypothetical protein
MPGTLSFRGSAGQVSLRLRELMTAIAGKGSDRWGVVRSLQLVLGMKLLEMIHDNFEVKANGGTDEAGIKWAPLKRETIAQRRLGPGDKKKFGIGGKRERGLLTPAENDRWRKLFSTRKWLLHVKFGMGEREASASAAKYAWFILKGEGAQTKLDVLGGRTVQTLRDTGELFNSLSPGVQGSAPPDGQIFRTPPGAIIVGTNKKPWHHAGIPGKLPARPFWPTNGQMPQVWRDRLAGTLQRSMTRALIMIFSAP